MDFEVSDFNGADAYFSKAGAAEWSDLEAIVRSVPVCLQKSDQKGKQGSPIFDPKATNALLTQAARARGWPAIPVPKELPEWGVDWDAGKGATIAEWQFSNYPFLWNNVVRIETVMKGGIALPGLKPIRALVVVTKSGAFPASNSTLYYEQARAQLAVVTRAKSVEFPIRLVGLMMRPGIKTLEVIWSDYSARYGRKPGNRGKQTVTVTWGKGGKARFSRPS